MDDTTTAWQCHRTTMGQHVACTVHMPLTPTLLLCLILNPGATSLSAMWQPFDKRLIFTSVACTVCTPLTPTLLSCLILNPGATLLSATWQPFNKQQTTNFHLPCCLHSAHTAHPHPPPLASRCHVAIGDMATKHWMTDVVVLHCHGTGTGWWHGDNSQCHTTIADRYTSGTCSIERLVQTEGQTGPRLANTIDPCLYPRWVTDPCNPRYTHTCTHELPWPSWRVRVLVGYRYRSLWWHPGVTCPDHYVLKDKNRCNIEMIIGQ